MGRASDIDSRGRQGRADCGRRLGDRQLLVVRRRARARGSVVVGVAAVDRLPVVGAGVLKVAVELGTMPLVGTVTVFTATRPVEQVLLV